MKRAWRLLGLVKGISCESSDRDRVEVCLIKIRVYLLNLSWMESIGKSIDGYVPRVTLFLQ